MAWYLVKHRDDYLGCSYSAGTVSYVMMLSP